MNENVIKAREAVQFLFSSPTTLQINATNNHVNQAAQLVACLSDPAHTKEKMCLLEQVKLARRLSRTRNLVNHGDFESPEWSGENGWKTSDYVFVQSDYPNFTGRSLHIPSAYRPQLSDMLVPTYAYQKIEESKLKPYTRYRVRASIRNSKDVEVFATRYGKEVHKRLNLPDDSIPANPSTGDYLLKQGVTPNQVIPQNMPYDPCRDGSHMELHSTDVVCTDSHEWQCHIDTGELDMIQNLGIWIGFKIGTTEGRATLSHVEVVEVGPLTRESLARMKKREQKWRKKWVAKRKLIERAVQTAREAIQALFTGSNQNQLQSAVTLKQILEAEKWVQQIPNIYHPFLEGAVPAVPGETYDTFQQFSDDVAIARSLYRQRNVLKNGDFIAGLSNWNATEGAEIQQVGNAWVLKLSDWSTALSQQVCVNPEQSYFLRVTARKEGRGEGYVTISDGTRDNTETLKFTVGAETTSVASSTRGGNSREHYNEPYGMSFSTEAKEINGYGHNQNMTIDLSDNYGANAYPGHTNMNYQSESFGFTPYGDENSVMCYSSNQYEINTHPGNCGCGRNTNATPVDNVIRNNDPSDMYETKTYSNNTNMPQGIGCGCNDRNDEYPMLEQYTPDLAGYITKTVEISPETNHVCIEIGETSGTFLVASIELIRMDC